MSLSRHISCEILHYVTEQTSGIWGITSEYLHSMDDMQEIELNRYARSSIGISISKNPNPDLPQTAGLREACLQWNQTNMRLKASTNKKHVYTRFRLT